MKMRVLIVDDELLVRIGIKSSIEWEKHKMEVVGEAVDGLEAVKQIEELKPDIVLLDIKMPNMDGIAVLHEIREREVSCKVLVLSGFDDIYHVKEAMKLGAVDYLHKPCMSPADILDALVKVQQLLIREKTLHGAARSDSGYTEKKREILKAVFLRELVDGRISDWPEFERKCADSGLNLMNGNFICLAFCVKTLQDVLKRYTDSNISILSGAISNVLNGILSKEPGIEFLAYERNIFVIIISVKNIVSERKIHETVDSVASLILDAMERFLNINVVIGVSEIHRTPQSIRKAYEESLNAMENRFYQEQRSLIYFRDIKRNYDRETQTLLNALIEKIKYYLAKHEYQKSHNTLQNMINFLKADPYLSGEEVRKIFSGLLFIVRDGKTGLEEIEMFNQCETLDQLYMMWLSAVKENSNANRQDLKYQSGSHLVRRISDYIAENYHQDITLQSLSNIFDVSANYISRFYKEETGEALFNHINRVRIDKAMELLKTSDLKIYEVGFKVGFKSATHFNIVFKKTTGLIPKQYRDNIQLY